MPICLKSDLPKEHTWKSSFNDMAKRSITSQLKGYFHHWVIWEKPSPGKWANLLNGFHWKAMQTNEKCGFLKQIFRTIWGSRKQWKSPNKNIRLEIHARKTKESDGIPKSQPNQVNKSFKLSTTKLPANLIWNLKWHVFQFFKRQSCFSIV